MVDISILFDFYDKNNKMDIIKYGIEKSEFNNCIPFNKICQAMLEKRTYMLYNLELTGMPRKYNNKKKITFDKSFDVFIDNLQFLFSYEISKYLLFRINSKYLLERIRNELMKNGFEVEDMIKYFKLFFKLYNKFNYKIKNQDEFENEILQTKFYQKHNILNINAITSNMLNDLNEINNSNILNTVIEVRDVSVEVLNIIMKYSETSKNITINSLEDLISSVEDLGKFDIGYEGSFLRHFKKYYNLDTDNDKIIDEYNIGNIIDEIIGSIENMFVVILRKIKNIHPDYSIELTRDFKVEIIEIMFDFFIHLGIEIAEEHSVNKCFNQSSKIHFKIIYTCLKRLLVKNDKYTDSQLLVLHYILLSSNKIEKMIEDIKMKK